MQIGCLKIQIMQRFKQNSGFEFSIFFQKFRRAKSLDNTNLRSIFILSIF